VAKYNNGPWLLSGGEDAEARAILAMANDPTGFNSRDTKTLGIIELCITAADETYYQIDESGGWSKHEWMGAFFGDGVTPLADMTICHYPVPGEPSFDVWHVGVKTEFTTAQTATLAATSGTQVLCYKADGTIFVGGPVDVYVALREHAIFAVATINIPLGTPTVFADERHGYEMSNATHLLLHSTTGARMAHGGGINGLADGATTFSTVDFGVLLDEDLSHILASASGMPFIYRDTSGDWAMSDDMGWPNNLLGFDQGSGVVYNRDNGDGTWDLVVIGTTRDYVTYFVFATNNAQYPYVQVVGQNDHLSRGDARDMMDSEAARLLLDGLPTPEIVLLYAYTIRGSTSGAIFKGADDEIYYDYRHGGYPAKMF